MFLSQPVAMLGNAGGERDARPLRPHGIGRTRSHGTARRETGAGTGFDVPADVVFVAYGFTVPRLPDGDDLPNFPWRARLFAGGCESMTNFPGVFASGSIVRGPASLFDVVRDARKAAAAIDSYLTTKQP